MTRKVAVFNRQMKESLKAQERDMMFAAYHMLERRRTNTKQDRGMTDFEAFRQMLPSRIRQSFMRKTDFDNIAKNHSIVGYSKFVDMMEVFGMLKNVTTCICTLFVTVYSLFSLCVLTMFRF